MAARHLETAMKPIRIGILGAAKIAPKAVIDPARDNPEFQVVAVNVDTARLDRPDAFLDQIGVNALTRYADPSGDSFETLRLAGKALGLPTSLIIDKDGCELGIVAGPVNWDAADSRAAIKALTGG